MSVADTQNFHTVTDDILADYAAGKLSAAKRFVISCQAAVSLEAARRLENMDLVGGALLETAKGEAVSDDFMAGVLDRLDETKAPVKRTVGNDTMPGWMPQPLKTLLSRENKAMVWTSMGFGMARMPILSEGREKLYLLKARAGMAMPKHSHYGDEWALILQGGYTAGGQSYGPGDLHQEDETCTHQPLVDDHGEDCITLVVDAGGVKFSNPVLRLLKPILGV